MKTSHTHTHIKSPYLFLVSLMLLLSGMLFPLQTHAQHEDLLDKTWYLYKLEIDGVEYEYHSLEIQAGDEATIKIVVENDLEGMIQVDGCPGRGCDYYIEFIEDENKIVLIDKLCLAIEFCVYYRANEAEYLEIENHYHAYFLNFGSIVDYDWETIDAIPFLVFTDGQGDKLYYTAENLSVSNFEELGFSIYPNPTQNQLNIRLTELPNNTSLKIYDIRGSLMGSFDIHDTETQLDVSEYASGMYFIKMREEAGNTQTVKFVKR